MIGLSPGQKLKKGKYEIIKEIGRGRTSITYLAKGADNERLAIKILNPELLSEDAERERLETKFWQEAVQQTKCSSPHIVKIMLPFKENSTIYLPMEYVDGRSLEERAQAICNEETALNYISQIAEALRVVHGQGLVHRDIRPANIFLRNRDGEIEAVLGDFGLAMDSDAAISKAREQEIMDGFSPIELYQASGAYNVAPYTDIYSLAATLYVLLTGVVPLSAAARKAHNLTLKPLPEDIPGVSGSTTKAIILGMKLEPIDRPQTMEEWLKILGIENKELSHHDLPKINWEKRMFWVSIISIISGIVSMLYLGTPAWQNRQESNPSKNLNEKSTNGTRVEH